MNPYTFFCNCLSILLILLNPGLSDSDRNIPIGYSFTLAVPSEYSSGFSGKAYLMETEQMPLNFRTALSVEAVDDDDDGRRYACSLEVFLGSVKVWSSGHRDKFYTSDVCMLVLNQVGELQLRRPNGVVGWRTGTSGQGVQKLELLDSGNLVLVDAQENIKWQTFNFPTNVLLQGQTLSVATYLTSFPTNNSTSFFSFEVHHDKLALYLNPSGKDKYSYWEFQPPGDNNITFIELSSTGLDLFNDKFKNFSQILSPRGSEPIRFLRLDNSTGNLGMYYFSPYNDKFEASFQALNSTCDLPLGCSSYEICTSLNICSCIIRLLTKVEDNLDSSKCREEMGSDGLCGKNEATMLELEDTDTLLKSSSFKTNISKKGCLNSCLSECKCAAVLYSSQAQECMYYDIVRGAKQVKRGSGLSYLVKVPKGVTNVNHKKVGLQKWVLILIVVADGLVLFLVVGGLAYFMVWKKRKRSTHDNSS